MSILGASYEEATCQISLDSRIQERVGVFALYTLKHYLGLGFRDMADLWRQQHRILPPISVDFAFPLWESKSVREAYLQVDTTPIVKLLMGRAMYGDTENVWFREVVQNALDANAARRALEGDIADTTISIHWDGKHRCIIKDTGIGMAYQHIIRCLTTLGRSIWASEEIKEEAHSSTDDSSKQDAPATIGKFGIGFASAFQTAKELTVRTRFFRGTNEPGWCVTFTAIDRPFFVEPIATAVGTEVEVNLATRLTHQEFQDLVRSFFLYIDDNVAIIPNMKIRRSLEDAFCQAEGSALLRAYRDP